jgi:predicted dienelactone hydrolase
MGHSYGGYTVLAVGGGVLSPGYARQNCQNRNQLNLNLSIALQCTYVTLPQDQYNLSDSRVIGVVAANAFTSVSFGPDGLRQLNVPAVMLGSTADLIVPMVKEATPAYAQFPNPERYFVQLQKGTHFSVMPPSREQGVVPVPEDLIGPPQTIGNTYFKAIALTFSQAYLLNDSTARQRLSQAGLGQLSDPRMPLAIVKGPLP